LASARGVLQPELADLLRGGPDEGDAGGLGSCGKARVFAQESVARVDGLGAGLSRGFEHRACVQVALLGGRRPDADGAVGVEHVPRVAVGFRIDGDRPHAQAREGTDDAASYFTAVGDQDTIEHVFVV
jgi:hypothetical protein